MTMGNSREGGLLKELQTKVTADKKYCQMFFCLNDNMHKTKCVRWEKKQTIRVSIQNPKQRICPRKTLTEHKRTIQIGVKRAKLKLLKWKLTKSCTKRGTFCPEGLQNLQEKSQIVSSWQTKWEKAARKALEEEQTFVKAAAEKEAKEAMCWIKEEDAAKYLFGFGTTFIQERSSYHDITDGFRHQV